MSLVVRKPVHKLINKAGAVMWLPASCFSKFSLGVPDVYTEDSAQQYPLGTKLEFADGRVFRYGKWGAASTSVPMARMVANANLCPGATGEPDVDGYEGNLYAAAAVGATYVDLYQNQADAENFYEDGMLAVYPTGHYVEYRIAGNELGNGTYVRCYLDTVSGIKTALTAGTAESTGGTGVTAYKSIFSQLKDAVAEGTGFISCMGAVLASVMTSGYFGWVQRRGRAIVTPTAYFGDTTDERMAQLHSDGCIALKAGHGTHTIGYLTQRTESGYGDLEIWLQF